MEAIKKKAQDDKEPSSLLEDLKAIGKKSIDFLISLFRRIGYFTWEGLWNGSISMVSLILVVAFNFLFFKFEEWIITVYLLLFVGLVLRFAKPKGQWGHVFILLGGGLDYLLSLSVFHWFILLLDTVLIGSTITSAYGLYERESTIQR